MLRRQVLHCFRNLHKTRKEVFKEDDYALEAARKRINEEFRKYSNETNTNKIQELLKLGNDVNYFLKTNIVQAKLNRQGNFEVQITKETQLFKNMPYKDN